MPMETSLLCGKDEVKLIVPDDSIVYESSFPSPATSAAGAVREACHGPIGLLPLPEALTKRREGDTVVVVSDVTRPIPYATFLPQLLGEIEEAGVPRDDIIILVAAGMHRPTTSAERTEMFGEAAGCYRIVEHNAQDEEQLVELPGESWAGERVCLNRHYVDAGFRLITGLVEPHFMAGFSGGRKAVCPGLAATDTIRQFHGTAFMGDRRARNANLAGNPCHLEALSVARMAPPDFSVNVVLNRHRELVAAFAGEFEAAHETACEFVRACACPPVAREADLVVTSSGGHPLDATFYQCVKGMVSCLPTVRKDGAIVAVGSCSEGIGSPEYAELMRRYSGRWNEFLEDIKQPDVFTRDQWQFQFHARALAKVGQENLHFITDGLPEEQVDLMSVTAHAAAQALLAELLADCTTAAIIPEGPYCAPVAS
ncbi:MAG: nickel-dependent lactate racemase family protein [Planctomycetota bacterium]